MSEALKEVPKESAPAPKSGLSSGRKKTLIRIAVPIVVLALGYFIYENYMFVSTDNAQVDARATLLSAKVSGVITVANVDENQKVKAGDVLVEIRADDYQNTVARLQADQASLQAQFKAAKSSFERTSSLLKKGASTQERLDMAEAQYRSLESRLLSAEAQVNEAKFNLGYTKIVAPVDGTVGKKSFEVGMLASPGQPLLGFVANKDRWVTANLKETDLDLVAVGKKATVEVDAISGKTFEGEVESISPATGATFTLLPPDNATGNFTKVVQRVPVRIKLQNLTEAEIDRLQNGLSAEVKIRVH
jgi:membrane fusion protein (multidrug efflux system)